MAVLSAVILLVAFWALLWAGAAWVAPDTRDGSDWRRRRSVTSRPPRLFD
jgi:hypothetical protein